MASRAWRVKAHRQLQLLHGEVPGKTCGKCIHLTMYGNGRKVWSKCDKTVRTGGNGSDWSVYLPACGLVHDTRKKEINDVERKR